MQCIFTHLHSIFLSILQIYTSLNFCICPLSKHFLCQFVEIWEKHTCKNMLHQLFHERFVCVFVVSCNSLNYNRANVI